MYALIHRVQRALQELEALRSAERVEITALSFRPGQLSFPCAVSEITDGFIPYRPGSIWSSPAFGDYALFRFSCAVPPHWDSRQAVIHLRTNQSSGHNMVKPQMMVFLNGQPFHGEDTNHTRLFLPASLPLSSPVQVDCYAFSGLTSQTAYGPRVNLDLDKGITFQAFVERSCPEVEAFYYSLKTPFAYLPYFEENSYEYQTILSALNEAVSYLDLRAPYCSAFYQGLEEASQYLQDHLYQQTYPHTGKATLVGHTHLDVAWLWRYSHTRDKAGRSFSTAATLLERYPDHHFFSSQAQLYQDVKTDFPPLYEKIKQLASQGAWEAEGAMWVEPDMNLCAGESIVRQILYGKRFFQEEFQTDCQVLWLPDVFGYSAALPQILKKSGIPYFMTAKLGNNELNRFPHDTFEWVGIDGSYVLAHLLTYLPGQYCPDIENGAVLEGWRNYREKQINDEILVPFGYSDGGGGPTQEQVETVLRMKNGLPGVPQMKIGTVTSFFKRLAHRVSGNPKLPKWVGEIYYERHRGTYTSMARIKRKNRQSEFLLSNTEWLWSLYQAFEPVPFPKTAFDEAMKLLLLNQFHDVLPGSSIAEVYDDSDAHYQTIEALGSRLCGRALDFFCAGVKAQVPSLLVFNPFSHAVSGYVSYQEAEEERIQYVTDVPAKGYTLCPLCSNSNGALRVKGKVLESQFYQLTLAPDGTIARLYDKRAGRECFLPGQAGNRLRIFEDRPGMEDNWNLDVFYTEREYELPCPYALEVIPEDCRIQVRTERTYGRSTLRQTMILYAQSPRIDFVTDLDWHEHSQVLRVDFPVAVNAVKATYEIQFGHIERPSHQNTSWQEAQFEVCGHKWADIGDNGYGMALLNDCKYGYSAKGSVLSLTLLRCGTAPNPTADQEHHHFTYAILPHLGSFRDAAVVQEAYLMNNPLIGRVICNPHGSLPGSFSLVSCDGAVLETVKPAESGEGTILRLYEPHNCSSRVTLRLARAPRSITFCDLLERPVPNHRLTQNGNELTFSISPFELVTLHVLY